jgi:hypothetical protein
MDITPPPTATTEPQADFAASHIFARMLDQLTEALPPLETESPAANALRHEVARAMVIATHPADPIEAALAISAAVAYQASLASNALAASPGLTGLQSNRYARTAIAQDHAFRAGVAALAKHRCAIAQPATPKRARAASPAGSEPEQQMIDDDPVPQLPQFQPRDRHGNPIPLYRFRDMTPLQRRTTYGDPYDTAGWAAATAEEDIAIAAQKAEDEAAKPTT